MAYLHRGYAYGDPGQHQRAIEDFDKAIQLDSDFADAYNSRGTAYAWLGEYGKQNADYAKACSLASQYC